MSDEVGIRLREVRKARGLSQRELAKRAGVTNSTISLIEQGRVSPSVSSLKKVLDGLPMTMVEFFTDDAEEDLAAISFPRDQQPNLGQGDVQFFLIGAGRPNRQIEIMREVYGPGADTGAEMIRHEGEEGGVVVSGSIELTVGETVRVLNPGDGYYFDCRVAHRFRNLSDEDTVVVSANYPPTF